MRRILLLSAALIALAASPALAVVSFGVHGGFDLNGQDTYTITESLSDGEDVSIDREEIKAPLMGGVHLRFGMLPVVDLELGVEGSLRKYHVFYEQIDLGDAFNEDFYLGRISVYASGKVNLINLPLVKGYGGAGLGYHVIAPLLSRELLEYWIVDQDTDLEEIGVDDIIDREGGIGAHILGGVRVKPAMLPIALSVEGRYYFLAENDYGDDTNRFFSVVFGLDLGF